MSWTRITRIVWKRDKFMDKYVIGVQFRGKKFRNKGKNYNRITYTDIKPQIIPKISIITWNNFGIIIISSKTSLIYRYPIWIDKMQIDRLFALKWRLTALSVKFLIYEIMTSARSILFDSVIFHRWYPVTRKWGRIKRLHNRNAMIFVRIN